MENEGSSSTVKIVIAVVAVVFAGIVAYSLLKGPVGGAAAKGGVTQQGSMPAGAPAAQGSGSDVVISVNGEQVMRGDFNIHFSKQMDFLKDHLQKQGKIDELEGKKGQVLTDKLKQDIAGELIRQILLVQDALSKGIAVSPGEIEAEVAATSARLQGMKLEDVLKSHNMTVDQYKKELRRKLIIKKYDDMMSKEVKVSAEEIKAYFESHKAEFGAHGKAPKLEEAREKITNLLSSAKLKAAYEDKFRALRDKAKISVSKDI
jgi:hypothetical protein